MRVQANSRTVSRITSLDLIVERDIFEKRLKIALTRLKAHSEPQYLVFLFCVIGDIQQDYLATAWEVSPAAVSRLKDRALTFLQESSV